MNRVSKRNASNAARARDCRSHIRLILAPIGLQEARPHSQIALRGHRRMRRLMHRSIAQHKSSPIRPEKRRNAFPLMLQWRGRHPRPAMTHSRQKSRPRPGMAAIQDAQNLRWPGARGIHDLTAEIQTVAGAHRQMADRDAIAFRPVSIGLQMPTAQVQFHDLTTKILLVQRPSAVIRVRLEPAKSHKKILPERARMISCGPAVGMATRPRRWAGGPMS